MVRIHPDPPPSRQRGAIAQLGERLLCKQEVTGSIPVGSIFSRRLSNGASPTHTLGAAEIAKTPAFSAVVASDHSLVDREPFPGGSIAYGPRLRRR